MTTIGLDIGGANLKAVLLPESREDAPRAVEVSFEMWKRWTELPTALKDIIHQVDPKGKCSRIAVTMTGELADCFSNKKAGVVFIADAVRNIAEEKTVSFYQVDGNWSDYDSVEQDWALLAASNWHAMARIGARHLPNQTGLVIDVGSTTTDIIPVVDGQPKAIGTCDLTRLENKELIYAGAQRTPVCSLIQSVTFDGKKIGLARELFATIKDALICATMAPEEPSNTDSADGRSHSIGHVQHRLARMVCSDGAELEDGLIKKIATDTIEAYRILLVEAVDHAIRRNEGSIDSMLLVGAGSFVAESALADRFEHLSRVRLSEILSPSADICGPAYAVAVLQQELSSA